MENVVPLRHPCPPIRRSAKKAGSRHEGRTQSTSKNNTSTKGFQKRKSNQHNRQNNERQTKAQKMYETKTNEKTENKRKRQKNIGLVFRI